MDEHGEVVDGDAVMALLASRAARARRSCSGGTLVATVMSNLGLHVAMRDRGITVTTTPVGDRYVVEEMLRGGYNLGGEQSGHLVFLDHNTTGDGLITALAVLALMVEKGRPLSELRQVMQRFPQVLVNLRVRSKPDVETLPEVAQAIRRRRAGARASAAASWCATPGTEALLRVMIEGEREPADPPPGGRHRRRPRAPRSAPEARRR